MELELSPSAKEDLRQIFQYGTKHWIPSQAEAYLFKIKQTFSLLIQYPYLGVTRADLKMNIRSKVIAKHIIYYQITPDCIKIIRVLHQSQDPLKHI